MKKKPEENPLAHAPERVCGCGARGPTLLLIECFPHFDPKGNRIGPASAWFCTACLFGEDEAKESAA